MHRVKNINVTIVLNQSAKHCSIRAERLQEFAIESIGITIRDHDVWYSTALLSLSLTRSQKTECKFLQPLNGLGS